MACFSIVRDLSQEVYGFSIVPMEKQGINFQKNGAERAIMLSRLN